VRCRRYLLRKSTSLRRGEVNLNPQISRFIKEHPALGKFPNDPCCLSSNNSEWTAVRLLLFLLARRLTLVFGIMTSSIWRMARFNMMGAYFARPSDVDGEFRHRRDARARRDAAARIVLEFATLRHFYGRDHLDHVLATFPRLILFFNDAVRLIWVRRVLRCRCPLADGADQDYARRVLSELSPGDHRRLAPVAAFLYMVVMRTRSAC